MQSMPSSTETMIDPQAPKRKQGFVSWAWRIPVALGLIVIALSVMGATFQIIATAIDQSDFPPPGQLVDVGGYQMHLYCTGKGSPTVILEHGGAGNSLLWSRVQPAIANGTRVCAYDRAGMGWSDPGPQPRTGQQIAAELHTLLHNANIPDPYVLVGWSYGGLFVRAYAVQYPEEVAGLVLLDATHPDVWTRTPQGQAQYQEISQSYAVARVLARFGLLRVFVTPLTTLPAGLFSPQQADQWRAVSSTTTFWATTAAEHRAILQTMAQLREAGNLGDLPLMVVTAGENPGPDGQWATYQAELASLSTQSTHIVVDGAQHLSLWLDPKVSQASSAAILQIVETVRTSQ